MPEIEGGSPRERVINAKGLDDRCEERLSGAANERCTRLVGHAGMHHGPSDVRWDQTTLSECARMADLIEGLGELYTREGVQIWLTGRHRLLDNRAPLDVIREDGGLVRVEAIFAQIRDGAYV